MTDFTITLPDGAQIEGIEPVVILGPNGSGKTRLSRRIMSNGASPEFINALRNTRISPDLPAMSQVQARAQHDNMRNSARTQPWEIVTDFDLFLSQLLAENSDSATLYRAKNRAGEDVTSFPQSAMEIVQQLWTAIFPGRQLEFKDWAPIIHNDRGEVLIYSANQMSDGERASLYLLAKVLLAKPDQILVIDEPETHFHSLLAVKLWDALEATRTDLRFIYVTHDLTFALSREPATFLLADPRTGLVQIEINSNLPEEIRKDILGAASFSYFASRIVFCEGDDSSIDKLIYAAWFNGRDTVVLPVGSCEMVKQCVLSLRSAKLIANLDAVGLIDRDFRPDSFFEQLGDGVIALPVHEIEGLLCLPQVAVRLGAHLGKEIAGDDVIVAVRNAITERMILRVSLERTQLRLLNLAQDAVSKKPAAWTEASLRSHIGKITSSLSTLPLADMIFEEERTRNVTIKSSGSIEEIIRTFPSKELTGVISSILGMKTDALFRLIAKSLNASSADPSLHALKSDLEPILISLGMPDRTVQERPLITSAI